jgi:LmbE family N-acetylglucosaminyl deacetylase
VTLHLPLTDADGPVTRVLVVGSHSDDIEIGCGATLLTLTRARADLEVTWVVLGAEGARAAEARASAERFLGGAARAEVVVHGFRDGFFPYRGADVKDVFESLKTAVDPQLVLTHTRSDLHQDHRLVCELTWNTFRDHLILEYEVPKYDGDLGTPNLFVPVSRQLAEEKTRLVLDGFATQSGKHWFQAEVFLGLMRLRGMEARSPSGYAEAFTCRKLSLGLD